MRGLIRPLAGWGDKPNLFLPLITLTVFPLFVCFLCLFFGGARVCLWCQDKQHKGLSSGCENAFPMIKRCSPPQCDVGGARDQHGGGCRTRAQTCAREKCDEGWQSCHGRAGIESNTLRACWSTRDNRDRAEGGPGEPTKPGSGVISSGNDCVKFLCSPAWKDGRKDGKGEILQQQK